MTTRNGGVVGRAFKPNLTKDERKKLIMLDYINELSNLPDAYVAYWEVDSRTIDNKGIEYIVRDDTDLKDLREILAKVDAE
jgi:hypothetical protein